MKTQDAVEVQAMPLERLEAEITELAGHLAAAESRWLCLIGEYDRRAGYAEWGCRTCAHWLSWQCGLDLRAARERVRVARALDELPIIASEFATGRLSYSKVRAVTRVATPSNESELVALATGATASHVERAVRAYRGVLSADEETGVAEARNMARYLRYDWTDDGSLEGSFRIPRRWLRSSCRASRLLVSRSRPNRMRRSVPRNTRVALRPRTVMRSC